MRADSSVTGVDFNIQDGDSINDDAVTSQNNGNGLTNGVPVFISATKVTADPTLAAQFPSYPQEFRFTYANVPTNGTANIAIRLKDLATGVHPSRFAALTRTVNTLAPPLVVHISNPASDGLVIPISTNDIYLIQTCFTPTLTTNNASLFSIYINGVLQPRPSYIFRPPGSVPGCSGLRILLYNWSGALPGTNVIQVTFSNNVVLSDTRTVFVPPELRISDLNSSNQTVVWDSAPGVSYQVLMTTNLGEPFMPIGPVIPANGLSTFYNDTSPPAPQKFYQIIVLP